MSKGIEDLGNGLGYIYVTDPSLNIVKTYINDADGARDVKLDGVKASSVAGNRVATAIVTVNAPTGNGTLSKVEVSDLAFDGSISYTVDTTAAELAKKIVGGINTYTNGVPSNDFTAVRIGNVVYIFTNSAAGTKYNGVTVSLVNTGNLTYTVNQVMLGGSSVDEIWDDAIGYNFYLDADYGATMCSGGGVAVPTSIANASDITYYIVNQGLQSSIPKITGVISTESLVINRKSLLTLVDIPGASADLKDIVNIGVSNGDILILRSITNAVSVNDTGNIILQSTPCVVQGVSLLTLIYNGTDGYWYELSRSVTSVADLSISTAKIQLLAITTALINDLAVTEGKIGALAVSTEKIQLLAITTALLNDLAVTEGKIGALAVSTSKIQLLAITTALLNDLAVTTGKIADANVTLAKLELKLLIKTRDVPVSFETGEQGDNKIRFPYACTVTGIYAGVTKALSGTDNATITPKNNAGTTMTGGVVTLTASSAIGTGFTSTPTANNTFVIGDILTLTGAKTTVAGKSLVTIELVKT